MKDDLIRQSDATEAVCRYAESVDPTRTFSGVLRLTLRDLPAVDAVEVVRCRECVNWEADWEPNGFNPDKPRYYCADNDLFTTGDWFCKDGQRREDGDNGKHL